MRRLLLVGLVGCTDILGLSRGSPLPEDGDSGVGSPLPVVTVATVLEPPKNLAVSGEDIFWIAGSRVTTTRTLGGAPRDLPQVVGTNGLSVDAKYVYSAYEYRVWAQPRDGSGTDAPKVLVEQIGLPKQFADDDSRLFWTDAADGFVSIQSAEKAVTGTLWKLATVSKRGKTTAAPIAIALAGDRVAWIEADASGRGALLAVSKTAVEGSPSTLAAVRDATALAADALGIAWTSEGAVHYLPAAAGAERTIGLGLGVALDATDVYWTTSDGTVARAPRAGGATETLATGQAGASLVVTTETEVFWANRGSIAKRAKR